MRSPLQNGIRWDTTPLPGCPPLLDEERDDHHTQACLNAGGFPHAVRTSTGTAWVYPKAETVYPEQRR